MELLGNTQILRQQAAALGMNPKDTLICVLKASISTGTYVHTVDHIVIII